MLRTLGLVATGILVAVNAPRAQSPAPEDSTASNEVTAVTIASGKLALSLKGEPGPVFLADGVYTNESKTVIVVLDGRITRIEYASGTVTRVASIRLQDQRVILTPPVTALMPVSPSPLPSGTFTSQDGAILRVVSGRPTEFARRGAAPHH